MLIKRVLFEKFKMKKTLTGIVVAGMVALGAAGCNVTHPEYSFNGMIGEEQVCFYETNAGRTNTLVVVRENGNKIEFVDDVGDDLKLEYVSITVGGNKSTYSIDSKNPKIVDVVEKAQKEFESYLSKIMEIQTAPLYND